MKQIQIRRKEKTHSYLPTRVIAEARKKLGSIFVSRSPLRGLTQEQERKYLPQVLGISADHPDFQREVRKFWADFSIDVPHDGVVLDITTDANGEPLNVDDWIKYEWAKKHRFVGSSQAEMRKDPLKTFYIYDPEQEVRKTHRSLQDKKAAYKEFIKLSTDPEGIVRVLRVLGQHNPDNMSEEQRENMLAQLMEDDPVKFLTVATDKNLETQDFLFKLIEGDIVRQIGSSFLYLDNTIGETLEEAIQFINSKRNTSVVAEMKAKMKEFASA